MSSSSATLERGLRSLILLLSAACSSHALVELEPVDALPPLRHYTVEAIGPFDLLWHPEIVEDSHLHDRVEAALKSDLAVASGVASNGALGRLKQTRIIVNRQSPQIPALRNGRGVVTHGVGRWLVAHGIEPDRAGVVEILNVMDYLRMRGSQPLLLIHELSHVLSLHADAGTTSEVAGAYYAALQGGIYDSVTHADGTVSIAYAMTDRDEYVAELSEALLGQNDYFPFTKEQLIQHDQRGCSAAARLWLTSCELE